jgi:tetratricopeptide (TPR) repeat protein
MSQPYDPNQPPGGYPHYPDPNQPQQPIYPPQYPQPPQQPYYPTPSQQPQAYPPQQPAYPSQPYQQPQYPQPSQQPQYPTPSQQPYYPTPSQQPYPGYAPTSPQQYGAPNYGDVAPSQPLPQQPDSGQSDGWPAPGMMAPSAVSPAPAKGIPGWVGLALFGVGILGAIGFFFTGSNAGILDWSQGAQHGGIFAAVVGLVALILAVIQLAGKKQALALGLVGVILLAAGGAAVGLHSPILAAQVSNLEGQNHYQQAVNMLIADKASNEDIAAGYDAWGENLTTGGQFAQAITEFEVVRSSYASATNGLARANKDEATAYYDKAESELHSSDFAHAVSDFQTLTTKFPSSPEAAKVHTDFAAALLGQGQADIAQGSCDSARSIYHTLVSHFGTTPSGATAKTALKQPQAVMGQFNGTVDRPSGEIPLVFLGQNLHLNTQTQQLSGKLISAALINTDGSYQFKPVALGVYGIMWGYVDSQGNPVSLTFPYNSQTDDAYYTVDVQALCAATADPISDTVSPSITPAHALAFVQTLDVRALRH